MDAALQELGGDHCSFGDFTLTITVWDEDEQTATEKARTVQQVVDGVGPLEAMMHSTRYRDSGRRPDK